MLTGLDLLNLVNCAPIQGQRVGLVCHAASVDARLRHITEVMRAHQVDVRRCFGPEHGIYADAQDMIGVEDTVIEPITGAPVRSLYGHDLQSLSPRPEDLADLDVLVIDLQDVGARYYTYIYTAALCVQAAAKAGIRSVVLDRPNPLGGLRVEGTPQPAEWTSFVGLWPLPIRHGLTVGEVVSLLNHQEGFDAHLEVVPMRGWDRSMYFDDTGLPWVQPSPNMPTLDTAIVYPGMCLIEGTLLSEGRGTTRPFELNGAAGLDPFAWAEALRATPVAGVHWRPVWFHPMFHKFGGQTIGGIAPHVHDRDAFDAWRAGLHLLATAKQQLGDAFAWRTEPYEFVSDRLAIDLLCGGPAARECIDAGGDIDALWAEAQATTESFREARQPYLLYPEDP